MTLRIGLMFIFHAYSSFVVRTLADVISNEKELRIFYKLYESSQRLEELPRARSSTLLAPVNDAFTVKTNEDCLD